jgi:hypothetical protein
MAGTLPEGCHLAAGDVAAEAEDVPHVGDELQLRFANDGAVDAATGVVGVAGADEAGGWGLLACPQAVSPAPNATAAMIGGTARRVKA